MQTIPDPSLVPTLQPCGGVQVELYAFFITSTVYGVNVNKHVSHILTLMQGVFNMLLFNYIKTDYNNFLFVLL